MTIYILIYMACQDYFFKLVWSKPDKPRKKSVVFSCGIQLAIASAFKANNKQDEGRDKEDKD